MSVTALKEAHKWFYDERGFIWVSDIERLGKFEHWQILRDRNGPFRGDCEDAALTIMNRLISEGVDPGSLFIVRCATELCPAGHAFDHAILGIEINGEWRFSDNRYPQYPGCTKRDLMSYTLYDAVSIENLRGSGSARLFK